MLEQPIHEEEYKDYTIQIFHDDDAQDPREWEPPAHMICFHRRYNLGDKHNFDHPDEAIEFLKGKDIVSLPLFLYDHSGITMSTGRFSCPWDSGQVGWIYMTKAEILKEWGGKIVTKKRLEKAIEHMKAEVETYDQYISGQVYGYNTVDPDGDDADSCWGYFGDYDDEYMMSEARHSIDADIELKAKKKEEALVQEIENRAVSFTL